MSTDKNSTKQERLTYYWASRFFAKGTRDDVFKLYSFVKVVQECAQHDPVDVDTFELIEQRWKTIKKQLAKREVPSPLDDSVVEQVMANIAFLVHRHHADPTWVDDFLKSMRWDLQKHEYRALKDTLAYVYGAGEVIGLFMVRILRMPEEALKPARMQARAFIYLDLVRDIPIANAEGRCYFPINEYKKFGLKNLSEEEARTKPKMFTDFMHAELLRFATWQAEANAGFIYVPKRLRIGLHALVDSYTDMAQHLKSDPLKIYEQHVRPKKRTVFRRVVRRSVDRRA